MRDPGNRKIRPLGCAKIDWRCEHKAVRILCLFHKFIHTVVCKHTFSDLSTDIALQAIRDRLTADLNDLRFNPSARNTFSISSIAAMVVPRRWLLPFTKHNLHAIKSPFYCSASAQTGIYCSGWFTIDNSDAFRQAFLHWTLPSGITPPSKPAKVTAYTSPNLEDVARK